MKKIILPLILIILPLLLSSQTIHERDSLIDIMCIELKKSTHLSDSLRLNAIYLKHFYTYLSTIEENKIDSLATSISFRFQRNCPEYLKILYKMETEKGDWEIVQKEDKPNPVLTKKKCKKFKKHKSLIYYESNGDKVLVEIKNGFWVDNFIDGTYSKLKFNWLIDCEFELEFIESNNESRKSISNVGDKYFYEIIDKELSHYILIAHIEGQDIYMKFKMYHN
jgi:uncharacterized protein YxeA